MGEAMDQFFGRGAVDVGGDDQLRRGAERNERLARPDGAEADRADRRVAAARRDRQPARQAQFIGDFGF